MFPDAPTANKIETVLAVAPAAAANHGLDLLSGRCSLGSLGLRQASIPFRRLSNAIICDLKKTHVIEQAVELAFDHIGAAHGHWWLPFVRFP
jgi:hypothetical protein